MKMLHSLTTAIVAALIAMPALVPALAQSRNQPGPVMGGAACYAVGQSIAQQEGGTLARATPAGRGGQTVCLVVVLVPGDGGKRPRRMEFTVPLN